MVLIGGVTLAMLRHAGMQHELREAEENAELAGRVLGPLITPAMLRGDPAARARLHNEVRRSVLPGPVDRIKVWTPDGRIAYSDEPRLIGRRFPLDGEERELLAGGGTASELSDLESPENRFERRRGEMLEVYTRVVAGDGTPLLFETYQPFVSITRSTQELLISLLPALLAGLLLLELVNLGFARWYTRRMRRVERQRAALELEAREATTSERRRIAADLHDGVFQELTAASLAVSGAARTLDERAAGPDTVEALDGAAQRVRDSVEALRTLVTSFYPPELEERGFAASLDHLAGLARTHGVAAEVVVPVELSAPPETQALLYRVAQEAVRNALNHSRPTLVSLRAGEDASGHWLEVEDDGGGFDLSDPVPHGHMGLRSLRDLVSGAGGRLTVSACPGEGCVVRAELPAAAVREVRI